MNARKEEINLTETLRMFVALTAVLFAVACTKERPVQKADADHSSAKGPLMKSLVTGRPDTEYLYVPSSLNSTRTTDATFPMYMGEAKIVKLKFSEEALNVVEIEQDDRFSGNPVNERPVLSIPVEHVDFRCVRDANGKCTPKEELDSSKPWANRSSFKILPEKMAVQEVNFLPIEISNLFYPCYKEIGSNFVSRKFEEDAINISVEKIYKADLECAGNISSLSDLTFRVVYHYSLVKLSTLETAGYKPLKYRRAEENTFGFFDTDTLKLDRDNNSTLGSQKTFVNRWAPTRTVVYYLTENFNKPGYEKIKAVTIEGINNINRSLEKAGAQLRILLKDAPKGMNPADLRNNSIVMVEDPVNFGILGYGPTAANPRTGEIVHGRAAMYLGVIKTGIKRAYEEVVMEKLAQGQSSSGEEGKGGDGLMSQGNKAEAMTLAPNLQQFSGARPKLNAQEFATIKAAIASGHVAPAVTKHDGHNHGTTTKSSAAKPNNRKIRQPVSAAKLQKHALRTTERKLSARHAVVMKDDPAIREQIMSTHCFYEAEMFNIGGTLETELNELVAKYGNKRWEELEESEKDAVIDTLLPFVWGPTLIHEVGHTLGLRHNFAGSEDKDNFYTDNELKELGASRKYTYSSVMDYGYRATNELQVMGKYDIAALRFGYAEKVELVDGSLISLEQFRAAPGTELKPYKYCTDEHVAVNPFCKRFDEGTSLVEMANHWVQMYEDNYRRRNFRNDALSYSLFDDLTHTRRLNLVMDSLRVMFERYDDIRQTFGVPDDAPEWESIDFLKDLKGATKIAAEFFIQVLETPDTLCAVARTAQPNQIIAVVPIRLISTNAISCFDGENVQLNPQFVVVGEAGKSFQSRKDPNSENFYMDQIDVRGIWMDKILAAKNLVKRLTGIESFDDHQGNFLDVSDLRERVQTALTAILNDEIVTKVPIRTRGGQILVAEIGVQFYNPAEAQNGHKILKPLHPKAQKEFGIPERGVDFQTKLVDMLQEALPSQEQNTDTTSLLNALTATAALPVGQNLANFLRADIGLTSYFVHMKSEVASNHVMSREVVSAFDKLGEEKLTEILVALEAGTPAPEDATDEEKLARALGADVIQKFLEGGFQDRSFYEKMIRAMAG